MSYILFGFVDVARKRYVMHMFLAHNLVLDQTVQLRHAQDQRQMVAFRGVHTALRRVFILWTSANSDAKTSNTNWECNIFCLFLFSSSRCIMAFEEIVKGQRKA